MDAALPLPDLTLPTADTSTVRAVLHLHARVLARDFLTLVPPATASESFRAARDAVERLLKARPALAVRLLRRPTHAALVGALRRRARTEGERTQWANELAIATLTDLSLSGALDTPITLPRPAGGWPTVRSIDHGHVLHFGDAPTITFAPDGLQLGPARFDPSAFRVQPTAYVPIVDGIHLALTDNNPLVDVQQHPERPGNPLELGDRTLDDWTTSLRDAITRVDTYLPLLGEELRRVVQVIVPVGFHAERHFSCSYEEAVGALYLSLHPNPMTMTEALVHEFQHNKLNAAFRLDPLLTNAWTPLYRSPVRPDPRPLHGVLLALHAFLPVAALYDSMTRVNDPLVKGRDFDKRFREIVALNREAADVVLPNSRPTAIGRPLFDELAGLDARFRTLARERWND